MPTRTVLNADESMYRLEADESGRLLLRVHIDGVASFDLVLPLNPHETRNYQKEGKAFLDRLVQSIRERPNAYLSRALDS